MVRFTPEDDPDRLSERLRQEARFKIQDRDSFDLAFSDIVSLGESELSAKQKSFRGRVFERYASANPDISRERVFQQAEGKSLRRDRKQTAKRVVKTKREFLREGASQVDLKGFDTARQKFRKELKVRREFNVPAQIGRRIVLTKRISVSVRGKAQVRFRDRRGRFASRK